MRWAPSGPAFGFAVTSDHRFPWPASRGHSPYGDGAGRFADVVGACVDAGFTEAALVQIGGARREPFPERADAEPLPALRTL
ncbi:hypothetical protein [Streptomyces decoyicus]|uniref:hypothetical protein n=1 Tax=Streptomyces decoyicus TaxID=249567 RepID=UPI003F4CEA03